MLISNSAAWSFQNFSRYNSVSINSFSGFEIMLIKKHKRFLKYTFYLLDHELHEIYKIDKIDANIFNCRIATLSYYYNHWCTSNCSICAVTTNTIILKPWINYIGYSSCPGNLLYFNWKWKNTKNGMFNCPAHNSILILSNKMLNDCSRGKISLIIWNHLSPFPFI